MEHLSVTHKMLILIIPVAVSLSSLVMGYFVVYFTMLEENIQDYHQYSDQELEVYFTVTSTVLPVGAFIGKTTTMQPPSSMMPSSHITERTNFSG
jgi:hypothetical protein